MFSAAKNNGRDRYANRFSACEMRYYIICKYPSLVLGEKYKDMYKYSDECLRNLHIMNCGTHLRENFHAEVTNNVIKP